jgi:transketolase
LDKKALEAVALSIRSLAMDAVQAAKSGHPGLPMGMAELGAVLYGELLNHDPAAPGWPDRDRFVLSAGHGSMLVYSLLHLSGYDLPLSELKRFRQLGSRTPGHPEYGVVPGVETTTGPLGQGVGNGVGMAIAERMLAARFNAPGQAIVDHYTYVLAGDGCMMEGVASESASLAGHLGLGKLIVFYDSNRITIEGSTDLAFTEDVAARYRAYNWHVQSGDAYDLDGIAAAVRAAKAEADRPSLIVLKSVIAKGSPNKAGTSEAHGSPLGEDEVKATRKALGLAEDAAFYVAPAATVYFAGRRKSWESKRQEWERLFATWSETHPDLAAEWKRWHETPRIDAGGLPRFEAGSKAATRNASGKVLNALAKAVPNLIGGSADLEPSNKSAVSGAPDFQRNAWGGRNMHFGVREHAMGATLNGMALHGGIRPYGATFLVFADYMRPSIRLAALMKLPIIYIFTHDSIYVGEDGPTHQPVEHLASLRLIPNVVVMRPADGEETAVAWKVAIERTDGPTVLALTRQDLVVQARPDAGWKAAAARGASIVRESEGAPRLVIVATGSEVELAVNAVAKTGDKTIRVVSMISRELFVRQDEAFQKSILPSGARRLVIEAGVRFGWEGIAGDNGRILSIDRFGESGAYKDVAKHFGFFEDNVVAEIGKLR